MILDDIKSKFKAQIKNTKESTNTKTSTITLYSTDRVKLLEDVQKYLKTKKIEYNFNSTISSIGGIDIPASTKTSTSKSTSKSTKTETSKNIRILFKPVSGGMSETTLNSTITELVPAVLFMSNKTFTDPDKCLKYLLEGTYNKSVYLSDKDEKAGYNFIQSMEDSSKFKEKMNNAFGVLKYLKVLNTKQKIAGVYWGYRAKPINVAKKHKGDIFVQYNGHNKRADIGISLKAGSENSEEPKLNTYVKPVLENLGYSNKISSLKNLVNAVYKSHNIPINPTYNDIVAFRKNNNEDLAYDQVLEICRDFIMKAFAANVKNTETYIKEQIIGEQKDVPLIVVKAFGTSYKKLTEEDNISAFLPDLIKITSNKGKSKQNFDIVLHAKTKKLILHMSIRTNNSKPKNKLAQGWNLAVKFNSITN